MSNKSSYLFVTCQRGAEAALKQEITSTDPEFRLAFSRPGFVTFKMPNGATDDLFERHWVFARTFGISLGKVQGEQLQELAAEVWKQSQVEEQHRKTPFQALHIWQRDELTPGVSGYQPGKTLLAQEIEQAVLQCAPSDLTFEQSMPLVAGGIVLDIVIVEPNQWWLGWHRAELPQLRYPGGVVLGELPKHAASRAYAKIVEAVEWASLPIQEGDEWIEIGCAPGGACQALLDRGQYVTGVDPAEVDPDVLKHPKFRHLRMRGAEVRRSEFRDVNWLAVDVNAAPAYTLTMVEDILSNQHVHLSGLVLILKMSDWEMAAAIPEYVAKIRSWGFREVRARQLASNGQEVSIVALKNRNLRRLRKGKQSTKTAIRVSPTDS